MARIRTIKPEFWKHEDLSECPEPTHMLAAALLNHSDDEGYFNAHPGLIKAECFPLRELSVSIPDSLQRLGSIGYLSFSTGSDGKRYGRINTFDDHQRVNRPTPSKIKPLCELWETSSTAHAGLSEGSPPERKGKEQGTGNGKESSLRSDSSTATPSTDLLGKDEEKEKPKNGTMTEKIERLHVVGSEAIAAYNRILGKPNGLLRAVHPTVGRQKRIDEVKRCVKVAREICQDQFQDSHITPEFWDQYFTACSEDGFTSGAGPYTGAHANWRPDFEFLTRPAQMLKVFEKATDAEGES